MKQKYDDQQRELQQAKAQKLQSERDISGYQAELAELRSVSHHVDFASPNFRLRLSSGVRSTITIVFTVLMTV